MIRRIAQNTIAAGSRVLAAARGTPASVWYACAGIVSYTTFSLFFSFGLFTAHQALAAGWVSIGFLLVAGMRHGLEVLEKFTSDRGERP